MSTLKEWLEDDARRLEFKKEALITSVVEQLYEAMERANVSKSQLAKLLSSSKSHVTQLLSGSRNMTLGSLSELADAVGHSVTISIAPMTSTWSHGEWFDLAGVAFAQVNHDALPVTLNDGMATSVTNDIEAAA